MSIQQAATIYHEAKFGRSYADGLPWGTCRAAEPFVLRSQEDAMRHRCSEVNAANEAEKKAKAMVSAANGREIRSRTKFLARVEKREAGASKGGAK